MSGRVARSPQLAAVTAGQGGRAEGGPGRGQSEGAGAGRRMHCQSSERAVAAAEEPATQHHPATLNTAAQLPATHCLWNPPEPP